MRLSKRLMALAMAGAMALGVSAGAVSFPDVDATTPEGEAIIKLSEMGVLGGFEDGSFRPEATVTRAQFAKIIYVLQNQGTEDILADAHKGPTKFPDVTEDQWFNGYVNWAVAEGIVGGYDDGTFKPDATLTMGQAIKMFVTANGVSADGIEYPQGFIDIAKEKGYLENVAEFTGNDNAPRGTIALVGANTLPADPTPDPEPDPDPEPSPEVTTYSDKSIVKGVDGNKLTLATMNVTALPTRTDAMQGKTVTTYTLAAGAEKTLEVAADCKIETFEGDFNGDMSSPAEGSLADVQVSTDSEFYVVEYQVEENVITSMKVFKKSVGTKVEQYGNGYLALPAALPLYNAKGSTAELALGTFVEAQSGTTGALVSFSQPEKGTVTMARSGRPFRVDYSLPANEELKNGEKVTFTWTAQTTDGKKTSSGVVTLTLTEATKCPDKTLTVAAGGKGVLSSEALYEGVQYAPGAPLGNPAFLLWDEENKTYHPSGTTITTEMGGEVTRKDGDIIEYIAPNTTGTDSFKICLNDGIGNIVVNVTVIIE